MAEAGPRDRERPPRSGYIAAIGLSALAHAVLLYGIFFIFPSLLSSQEISPPAYTVKIVDNIPAGDLGTRLPPLSGRRKRPAPQRHVTKTQKPPEPLTHPKPVEPDHDRNAIALNTHTRRTATPSPTPTPARRPRPTVRPTPRNRHGAAATQHPTPRPTARPHQIARPKATPKPHPKATRSVMMARAEPTPNVKEQLAKLREQLLAEHLARKRSEAEKNQPETHGPVVANTATEGSGYGTGGGTGSMGVQQDPEFLVYYRTVQDRIKKAWSFGGGNSDLTTTALFAIGPDGKLLGVKVTHSSHDAAFDDSVVRAIRLAAPFPPPPEKYRSQFGQGVEALFKLGELKS